MTKIAGLQHTTTGATIDTIAGTIHTIFSGGGSPDSTNIVDINPSGGSGTVPGGELAAAGLPEE